jgi:hypothetical protein
MMLISSISDVGWCCCKWVENRSQFRSSNAELGLAVMSGSAAAGVAYPADPSQMASAFSTATSQESQAPDAVHPALCQEASGCFQLVLYLHRY